MSEEELGFDPTIIMANGQRFVEIERDGTTAERLLFDSVMKRARCITGRATTRWKAHREGASDATFVGKDSWQTPERDEEAELLRESNGGSTVVAAEISLHC
jgi:hypothetical protein